MVRLYVCILYLGVWKGGGGDDGGALIIAGYLSNRFVYLCVDGEGVWYWGKLNYVEQIKFLYFYFLLSLWEISIISPLMGIILHYMKRKSQSLFRLLVSKSENKLSISNFDKFRC